MSCLSDDLARFIDHLTAERAAWAHEADRATRAPPALIGHPYVVIDDNVRVALTRTKDGERFWPVELEPGLPGVTSLSGAGAAALVEAARVLPGAYRAVLVRDIPGLRMARLDGMIQFWSRNADHWPPTLDR